MNTTAVVTLSADHRITIPVEIARQLDLRPGAKINIESVDNQLVLTPQPQDFTAALVDGTRNLYGHRARDADEYLQIERASWEADTP